MVACGPLAGAVARPYSGGAVADIRDYHVSVTGGQLAAGDDAAAARWVTPAERAVLDAAGLLTDQLAPTLQSWGV